MIRLSPAVVVILSTFTIDLISKWFVETHVTSVIPIVPTFNITLGYSRGVGFGLFDSVSPYSPYVLAYLTFTIVIILSVALWRSKSLLNTAGLAAIVGGALGNIVDRLGNGTVTDFLDFYVGQYHWPTFNIADTFIFCGVILLFITHSGTEQIEAFDSEQSSNGDP